MMNDRPIEDANLRAALLEVQKLLRRRGLAGALMIVAERETAFAYAMSAPWSAIKPDPDTPLGFRIRAKSADEGKEVAERRLEGALHTICQIRDFGEQTMAWMEELQVILRQAGIDFVHTPFGGNPVPRLGLEPPS